MIVLDSSAVVALLVARTPPPGLGRRVSEGELHAPHLLDVEVLHALRRMVARRALALDRAQDARTDFADLDIARAPHTPLADRAWALGDNLSAYDAVFLALAELLDAPLITCDARLANAPGVTATVELYGAVG